MLTRLNVGARIVLCGLIAEYDTYSAAGAAGSTPAGESAHPDIARSPLVNRALMQSFLVLDHTARFPEAVDHLAALIEAGQLTSHETVVDGLERAPAALAQLFDGSNTGKLLVKVADPE